MTETYYDLVNNFRRLLAIVHPDRSIERFESFVYLKIISCGIATIAYEPDHIGREVAKDV
jgi:hypothetical protein